MNYNLVQQTIVVLDAIEKHTGVAVDRESALAARIAAALSRAFSAGRKSAPCPHGAM